MSQPVQLYRLQQVDSKLDEAHARLKEIEEALSNDAALKKANKQAEDAKQAFQSAQIALKQAEQDVETQEQKIDNNQKRLYGGTVTNPKELEDLQMEAEALKRHLTTLEDVELEKMVAFESSEAAHQAADENLEKVKTEVASKNKDLASEQADLQAQVAELEKERQTNAGVLDAADLAGYEKLREKRRGVAVALVKDKACGACGSTLSAAQAQAARLPSQITHCDNCGRILYSG